jgi:hypothetical protein
MKLFDGTLSGVNNGEGGDAMDVNQYGSGLHSHSRVHPSLETCATTHKAKMVRLEW